MQKCAQNLKIVATANIRESQQKKIRESNTNPTMSVYLGGKWKELQEENNSLRELTDALERRSDEEKVEHQRLQTLSAQQGRALKVLQIKHSILQKEHAIARQREQWYAGASSGTSASSGDADVVGDERADANATDKAADEHLFRTFSRLVAILGDDVMAKITVADSETDADADVDTDIDADGNPAQQTARTTTVPILLGAVPALLQRAECLQMQNEDLRAQNQRLAGKKDLGTTKNSMLQQHIAALKRKVEVLEYQLAVKQEQIGELQKTVFQSKSLIRSSEKQLIKKDALCRSLTKEKANLFSELTSVRAKCASLFGPVGATLGAEEGGNSGAGAQQLNKAKQAAKKAQQTGTGGNNGGNIGNHATVGAGTEQLWGLRRLEQMEKELSRLQKENRELRGGVRFDCASVYRSDLQLPAPIYTSSATAAASSSNGHGDGTSAASASSASKNIKRGVGSVAGTKTAIASSQSAGSAFSAEDRKQQSANSAKHAASNSSGHSPRAVHAQRTRLYQAALSSAQGGFDGFDPATRRHLMRGEETNPWAAPVAPAAAVPVPGTLESGSEIKEKDAAQEERKSAGGAVPKAKVSGGAKVAKVTKVTRVTKAKVSKAQTVAASASASASGQKTAPMTLG